MVEDGKITEKEAADHPKKHLITRAVGVDSELRTDFCQEDVESGDIILLCTDGLTNSVGVEDMVLLGIDTPLEEYVGKLVDKALENGGRDNITVAAAAI